MIKNKRTFFGGLAIALVIAVLDQLSKVWLIDVMHMDIRPPVAVTGFFNLVLVWNYGVSFGMLSGHRAPLALGGLALVIVLVLGHWLARVEDKWAMAGIGLVIGGAVGNVLDRARFGAVLDFLDFHAAGLHWPAFNIADSAIFMGVVVLCYQAMIQPRK